MEPLLSEIEIARITGRARSTLQKDRVAGIGIPFIRLGRLVRYRRSDVEDFLASLQTRHSTSEYDASTMSRDDTARTAVSKPQPTAAPATDDPEQKPARLQSGRRQHTVMKAE